FALAGQAGVPAKVLKFVGGLHWKPATNRCSAASPLRPRPALPLLPIPTRSPPSAVPPPPPPQAARAAVPPRAPVAAMNRRREVWLRWSVRRDSSSVMSELPL